MPEGQHLPTEVIQRVLTFLEGDRSTLAKCMRVSSTLNTIAAPLLYRSIIINGTSRPYVKPAPLPKESDIKGIMSNMAHVKDFTCGYHSREQCFLCFPGGKPLQIATLKVLSGRSPYDNHYWRHATSRCRCILLVAPSKLVFLSQHGHGDWGMMDNVNRSPSVKSISVLLGHSPASGVSRGDSELGFLYGRLPSATQIFFVLWTTPPRSTPRSLNDRSASWTIFLNRQHARSLMEGCPREVVYVNMETFALDIDDRDRSTMSLAEAATKAEQRTHARFLMDMDGFVYPAELEWARHIKFKFISMQIYLAEHDWQDVLTEEQAAPWLALMEQGDARKRKRSDEQD